MKNCKIHTKNRLPNYSTPFKVCLSYFGQHLSVALPCSRLTQVSGSAPGVFLFIVRVQGFQLSSVFGFVCHNSFSGPTTDSQRCLNQEIVMATEEPSSIFSLIKPSGF